MSQFRVDPSTGDLVRVNGSLQRVTGAEEIVQHVRVRMRLFLGECVFRQDLGMFYIGGILEKGFTAEEIAGEYRSAALETPGVVTVDEVTLEQTDEQRANRVGVIRWSGSYSETNLAERLPIYDTLTVDTSE